MESLTLLCYLFDFIVKFIELVVMNYFRRFKIMKNGLIWPEIILAKLVDGAKNMKDFHGSLSRVLVTWSQPTCQYLLMRCSKPS